RLATDRSELLRVTLASIGDGVVATDATGRVTSLNAAAETLMGWKQSEAVGRPFEEIFRIVNETTRQTVENPIASVLAEGKVVGLANHTLLIARDGAERPIEDSVAPIKDEQGLTTGCVLVFHDVSEQRVARRDVEQSEANLRDFFDNAAVGLHWVGPDGIIQRVNQAELDMLGYERDEYVGRHIAEFHVDQPVISDILARLTRGEALHEYPARLRCKDGSIRYALINSNVMRQDGEFIHTRCITRDITEHKRAEASLQESRDVLALAMRGGRMGAWSRDMSTNVTWWSRELEEIFGLEPGRFEGTEAGFFARVHDDDRADLGRAVEGAIQSLSDYVVEFRFRHASSEWRWMEGRGRAIYGDDGKPRMLYGLGIDITERKLAEESLRGADRRKDLFLATLSHELRNPLTPIRNAIQISKSPEVSTDDLVRAREIIDRQVSHLTRLVDDLLDVSRISANKLQVRMERVELATVIESAVETSQPNIEAAGHHLVVCLPSEPLYLNADPVRISQVLSNLLNNAARYTENGGEISLTAERDGSDVVLSVRDNGTGIASDLMPRVFEAFTQGSGTLDSQGGLGIGLSLAHALVEVHGGSIRAQSEGLGRGSQFTVRLPLIVNTVEVRELSSGVAARGHPDEAQPSYRLLVADDLRDAADTLAMLMRIQGHEVRTAYDGEMALSAAEAWQPQVLLLDIGMPKGNGYEVAQHIRSQPWGQSMFLVALTGWANESDRQRAEEAGFDLHIVKPVSPDTLEQLLTNIGRRARLDP
ncbi:MAG: PAS domain S-box protein, partial [Candidatus Eisenbacteria bacterium]